MGGREVTLIVVARVHRYKTTKLYFRVLLTEDDAEWLVLVRV
jgi:hypothetical protein